MIGTKTTRLMRLLSERASRETIREHLDGLSPRDRVQEALSLHGDQVGQLYDATAGGPPLSLTDFVPASVADGTTIIFEGRNSLPSFTRFQKRFARLESGQVIGYNHQLFAFATGPGFFAVKDADASADVPDELYFDYTERPRWVPVGWPGFKPNESGLSYLVYRGMKDYMRSVADNVVVGAAYKGGKLQRQYFLLTRPGS